MLFNDSLTEMEPTSFCLFDNSVAGFMHTIHFVLAIQSDNFFPKPILKIIIFSFVR